MTKIKLSKDEPDAMIHDLMEIIQDLSVRFEQINVPVLVSFKVSSNKYSKLNLGSKSNDPMLDLAGELLDGDIDLFLRSLIRHAKKNGHSSLLLKAMGIPNNKS